MNVEAYSDDELAVMDLESNAKLIRRVVDDNVGRTLGETEFWEIYSHLLDQVEESDGEYADAHEAYDSYLQWVEDAHDMSSSEGRENYMADRVSDVEDSPAIRFVGEFDLSTPDGRADYMAAGAEHRLMENE